MKRKVAGMFFALVGFAALALVASTVLSLVFDLVLLVVGVASVLIGYLLFYGPRPPFMGPTAGTDWREPR